MPQHLHLDPAHSLHELMRRAIARVPEFLGQSVRVDVAPEGIVISGVVRSYYHKQMAQESLRRAAGTTPIHNRLTVDRAAPSRMSSTV